MKKLSVLFYNIFTRRSLRSFGTAGLFFLGTFPAHSQYTVLHNFGGFSGDGKSPYGSLTLSGDKLYGMTTLGGSDDSGCIFSIDTNGSGYKKLLDFNNTNGGYPFGSLIISANVLYGVTYFGGANGKGCIFSIDTSGNKYKDILDFNGINGASPHGTLLLSGKVLFGMTSLGGTDGFGCIFSIDTNGHNYKDLLNFDGDGGNGAEPRGSLTLFGKVLYGMTYEDGQYGNIFSIDTNGNGYKQLHYFDPNPDGNIAPTGSLIFYKGELYGMTSRTYLGGEGNIFSIDTNGNSYKDLFDFPGGNDGGAPWGSLMLSGGVLYGMANNVFSIDTNGNGFKVLYNFNYITGITGESPYGDLTLSGNIVYGMTRSGGTDSNGVIFSLNYVTAGINNLTSTQGATNIYPNPSNGIFTLSLSNINAACNIEIYNVLGEKVYTEDLAQNQSNNTINIAGQPAGVYFYRVLKDDGGLAGEGKVVVQK